jgi:hypothetical protein
MGRPGLNAIENREVVVFRRQATSEKSSAASSPRGFARAQCCLCFRRWSILASIDSTKNIWKRQMRPETKLNVANGVMAAGLLPYVAVFSYVALMSRSRGDAALAAVFTSILGLGIAYIVALAVALPASLWSRSLAESCGFDTRCSMLLRRAVDCGVFPVFAIFPVLACAVLR